MEERYYVMAVAFIDVLGTRARTEFAEKLRVHKLFHPAIQAEEKRQHSRGHFSGRKTWSFSDCAYIAYYQRSTQPDIDGIKVLAGLLDNLPLTILRFWNEGFLVRGGVALGEGYLDDLGCFGPAFEEASSYDAGSNPPFIFIDETIASQLQTRINNVAFESKRLAQRDTPALYEEMKAQGLYEPVQYWEKFIQNEHAATCKKELTWSIVNILHSIKRHTDGMSGHSDIDFPDGKIFLEKLKGICSTQLERFKGTPSVYVKWSAFDEYLRSKDEELQEQLQRSSIGFMA